jgi:hypothetical protein
MVVAACSSHASDDTARATATTAAVVPSTLLDGTSTLSVPFTADEGSLVVTPGRAPDGLTQERALTRFHQLRGSTLEPTVVSVVSGEVTLRPGLTATPVVNQPAWVISYTIIVAAACPAMVGEPDTAPPTASHLHAFLMFGDEPVPSGASASVARVIGYEGAGTGICEPSTEPIALSEDQLNHGEL